MPVALQSQVSSGLHTPEQQSLLFSHCSFDFVQQNFSTQDSVCAQSSDWKHWTHWLLEVSQSGSPGPQLPHGLEPPVPPPPALLAPPLPVCAPPVPVEVELVLDVVLPPPAPAPRGS